MRESRTSGSVGGDTGPGQPGPVPLSRPPARRGAARAPHAMRLGFSQRGFESIIARRVGGETIRRNEAQTAAVLGPRLAGQRPGAPFRRLIVEPAAE